LQAVEGADDLALRGKAFTEASLIDQTQRDELFVALHEIR